MRPRQILPHGADFNPRSPHGERRPSTRWRSCAGRFQSTLPARGATSARTPGVRGSRISIHAPRTGSDIFPDEWGERSDPFQSTLPARGATVAASRTAPAATDFNPRSPHGERPPASGRGRRCSGISIHAPRTGSDRPRGVGERVRPHFNPRSPHGERPGRLVSRVRWDAFQSTLPARGATSTRPRCAARRAFQSTLPARGATQTRAFLRRTGSISIHAPRTGSDHPAADRYAHSNHFNPRSPHGERHNPPDDDLPAEVISIHAPRTGSDRPRRRNCCAPSYFNPRSPHGERHR